MRSMRFFILPALALLLCAVANSQEFPKAETLEVRRINGGRLRVYCDLGRRGREN